MARVASKRPRRMSNVKRPRAGQHRQPVSADESDSLETRIVSFARGGKLKKAGHTAVKSQLEAGLSVVYQAGNLIVREHPDGTRETVRTVEEAFQPVPDRFRSFVVSKLRK